MTATARLFLRTLLPVAAALALAGCPEGGTPERGEKVEANATDPVARKSWLTPTDATPPALWLASREAGEDLAESAPEVAIWRARLDDADQRFSETERMIANRAVQLSTMLSEIGIEETAEEILANFAPLAATGSRSGFSDICQHYFNLRSQGKSRKEALATLRAEPAHQPARRENAP
ncbi:exo-alpha-sialidase [Ancylobacter mangrovi]|uniref:exo-alpha-sialidase n=1 Tax=Ancylobacter mangrovi TaxID=2972472 RepID=UPI002162547F|nr:exo-alpha-sialidase [Ancylobacter mangrovi]MCS0504722.1 exo-alpha-sialidase [Ancylobacter mangrovi]